MKNEKKSNNSFFTFTFLYRKIYIFLDNIFGKTQFILLHLHYHFFKWQVTESAATPTPIQIFIDFVDTILRSKILGNRLGILTQILIAMDYFFYLYLSDKCLQFRGKKYINLSNQFHYKIYNERDRNIRKTFVFIFHHSIYHEAAGCTFSKEKKGFYKEYLKRMYIILKGIGKILFVSVLQFC